MITVGLLFLILSAVAFLVGAANPSRPPINWLCLGFGFWVLAILFGYHTLVL